MREIETSLLNGTHRILHDLELRKEAVFSRSLGQTHLSPDPREPPGEAADNYSSPWEQLFGEFLLPCWILALASAMSEFFLLLIGPRTQSNPGLVFYRYQF